MRAFRESFFLANSCVEHFSAEAEEVHKLAIMAGFDV